MRTTDHCPVSLLSFLHPIIIWNLNFHFQLYAWDIFWALRNVIMDRFFTASKEQALSGNRLLRIQLRNTPSSENNSPPSYSKHYIYPTESDTQWPIYPWIKMVRIGEFWDICLNNETHFNKNNKINKIRLHGQEARRVSWRPTRMKQQLSVTYFCCT